MLYNFSPKTELVNDNQVFKSYVATTGIAAINKQMEFARCWTGIMSCSCKGRGAAEPNRGILSKPKWN